MLTFISGFQRYPRLLLLKFLTTKIIYCHKLIINDVSKFIVANCLYFYENMMLERNPLVT